jgi:hypothetical protein
MKFRIKIETLNNGEKRYVAQLARLQITGGWIKRTEIRWVDMYGSKFLTEEEATHAIECYRKCYEQKKAEEVKSVIYKEI